MDHEKLDVSRVTLEVVTRIGALLKSKEIDRSLRNQVVRSSTSILLNIAEGPGKRSLPDRRRYYEIARGSAMETAAALDVLVAWECADPAQVQECKTLLRRIVAMLTKMTEVAASSVREEIAEVLGRVGKRCRTLSAPDVTRACPHNSRARFSNGNRRCTRCSGCLAMR